MDSTSESNASPTQELLKGLLASGLSQLEITRLTGIPQPKLSRWAAGGVAGGADDALKLQALANRLAVQNNPRRRATDRANAASGGATGLGDEPQGLSRE